MNIIPWRYTKMGIEAMCDKAIYQHITPLATQCVSPREKESKRQKLITTVFMPLLMVQDEMQEKYSAMHKTWLQMGL